MRSTFKVLFYLKRNKEQPLAPVMDRMPSSAPKSKSRFACGKSKAVVRKARMSKPTVSIAIWTIFGGKSTNLIRIFVITTVM